MTLNNIHTLTTEVILRAGEGYFSEETSLNPGLSLKFVLYYPSIYCLTIFRGGCGTFYSASSQKQHVAPLGHIILIPSQPIFALSPECYVISGEATYN
jgi:hypothetical protein